MSEAAIQQLMHELEALPESDQQVVLGFVTGLRQRRRATENKSPRPQQNSALQLKSNLLVFTGQVGAPETDWVQVVRDERDEELLRLSVGGVTCP